MDIIINEMFVSDPRSRAEMEVNMKDNVILKFWFHIFSSLIGAIFLIATQQIEYFKLLTNIQKAEIEFYFFIKLFLICWVIINLFLSYFKIKKIDNH